MSKLFNKVVLIGLEGMSNFNLLDLFITFESPVLLDPTLQEMSELLCLRFFLLFSQSLLKILLNGFSNLRETLFDDLRKVLVPVGLLPWMES